jgi:hypothetical protein
MNRAIESDWLIYVYGLAYVAFILDAAIFNYYIVSNLARDNFAS